MDNKDEKTFTDLFSSFKEEPEIKTQTFSDILNNDTNKEDSPTTVTFDSLFEQISSEEENSISLFEENNKNKVVIEEPLIKTNNEEANSANKQETNIFFKDINNPNLKDKEPKTNDFNEKLNNLDDNDFNVDFSINPFMNENISNEENNTAIEKEIKSNELTLSEANPFFEEAIIQDNSSEDSLSEKKVDTSINPFMNEDISNEENNIIIENKIKISEPTVEINSIFKEKEKTGENINENNPFLNAENNQSSIISDKKKEEKETENIEVKSSSPFFEEEKKNEENPFFQNQLNLVENKVPDNPKGTIDSSKSKHYNVKVVKQKEPLIKLILGVLSYALFIWLLLIGITLLVYVLDIKIRAAKGDYSSPTFNAYVVLTGSMLPEIQVYDVVVTKKVDAKKLKEGDVITFASADTRFLDTIITHRIIKKNPPNGNEGYTFQTQGDNNNVADNALVPENRIFGKVILKIPKLGYLQDFLASRGGWIIVILIPCLTVISYDTVKLVKGLKKKKYKNIKVQK